MGKADQFAKRIFEEETERVTGQRVRFEVPSETPVGSLTPDGIVRVVAKAEVESLAAPWCRLRSAAVIEIKMRGDHIDRAALARAEFRRWALWVQWLERTRVAARVSESPQAPAQPEPDEFALWVVGPRVPVWLRQRAASGAVALASVAPGCWQVGPRDHELLWVAANELPLRVELVPLLLARTGAAFVAFLKWAAVAMGFAWVERVVQELPMDPDLADEFSPLPEDDESQRKIKQHILRSWLEHVPEVANEIREKGREKGVEDGLRQSIALALSARTLELTPALRARLDAESRVEVLQRWLTRAVTATRVSDVFADPMPL